MARLRRDQAIAEWQARRLQQRDRAMAERLNFLLMCIRHHNTDLIHALQRLRVLRLEQANLFGVPKL